MAFVPNMFCLINCLTSFSRGLSFGKHIDADAVPAWPMLQQTHRPDAGSNAAARPNPIKVQLGRHGRGQVPKEHEFSNTWWYGKNLDLKFYFIQAKKPWNHTTQELFDHPLCTWDWSMHSHRNCIRPRRPWMQLWTHQSGSHICLGPSQERRGIPI